MKRKEKRRFQKEKNKRKQSKKKELILDKEKVDIEVIENKSIENDTVTFTEVDIKEEVDKSIGKEEWTLESDDSLKKLNSDQHNEPDAEQLDV